MIKNVVVVSDIHAGCAIALCPPRIRLDEGGRYTLSKIQKKLWAFWQEFWDEWVPEATRGEPFTVVFNGDGVNGKPHGANTNITDNWSDQIRIGHACMDYALKKPGVQSYYHIRGTEAHVGKGAEMEEVLGRELGAVPNEEEMHSRFDLWLEMAGSKLVHCLHHIGTTGSQSYESTAVHKELVEEFTEAGRWRNTPPDVVVRSHRHRYMKTSIPIGHKGTSGRQSTGEAFSVVTPCWQGKTPFVWKIPGGRLSTPQFGGIVIRYSEDGELFIRPKVWTVDRSRTVRK